MLCRRAVFCGAQIEKSGPHMIDRMHPSPVSGDSEFLRMLGRVRMPFGKYAQRRIMDLPESYLVWFRRTGFPPGRLGRFLEAAYEVKLNGLSHLIPRE